MKFLLAVLNSLEHTYLKLRIFFLRRRLAHLKRLIRHRTGVSYEEIISALRNPFDQPPH